ncbi:MAG: hypothetical protein KF846_04525 [Cyclobacteriaceae bacterium]|nr:hypothetical protein [Cyclobacteriaceae bacterium]
MKRPIFWLVLLCATLQHCVEEGQDLNPVSIQFTCVISGQSPEGGRQHGVEPTTLRVSLEDNDGNVVFTLKEIQLLKLGDAYITEPLELLQGYYRITDFLLVADNQVQYATPRRDSPLAQFVNSPLPYGLWVSKNSSLTVAMEVIDVTQQAPEDFGYASFFINVINVFEIAVFTSGEQGYSLTDATVRILKNDEVVKLPIGTPAVFSTNYRSRAIFFPGNPDDTYLLEVKKEGYATYRKWFIPRELIASLNNLPLKVYLVPSVFTMLAYVDEQSHPDFTFEFYLSGEPGKITIDWGDGTHTAHELMNSRSDLVHTYASSGNYPIAVTGDLDKITGLGSYYSWGRMDELNIQGLTGLQSFSFGLTNRSPKVIDLRHNHNLEIISFPNLDDLENVILPMEGKYNSIEIHGPNQLSTTSIDKIIGTVFESVSRNKRSGFFAFASEWYNEFDTMIGPPSSTALEKLRVLRDVYNWEIRPDPL